MRSTVPQVPVEVPEAGAGSPAELLGEASRGDVAELDAGKAMCGQGWANAQVDRCAC